MFYISIFFFISLLIRFTLSQPLKVVSECKNNKFLRHNDRKKPKIYKKGAPLPLFFKNVGAQPCATLSARPILQVNHALVRHNLIQNPCQIKMRYCRQIAAKPEKDAYAFPRQPYPC